MTARVVFEARERRWWVLCGEGWATRGCNRRACLCASASMWDRLRHMLIKTGGSLAAYTSFVFVCCWVVARTRILASEVTRGRTGKVAFQRSSKGFQARMLRVGCCRSLMTLGPSLVACQSINHSAPTLEAGPDTHAALPLSPNVDDLYNPTPGRSTTIGPEHVSPPTCSPTRMLRCRHLRRCRTCPWSSEKP
jgi:hypothetical protein